MLPDGFKQDASKFSVALENYIFENITDSKQIGRTAIINDSNESMVYSASYPVIGNEAIDQIISSDVQSVIDAFKTANAGYAAINLLLGQSENIQWHELAAE